MGQVYVVEDLESPAQDRRALKRLRADLAAARSTIDMFMEEARIAAAVEHPNVVHTLDVGEDAAGPYLVMELVDGFTVGDWIRDHAERGRVTPLLLVVEVGRQAATGLRAAHDSCDASGQALSVVHRDISPQNILIDASGVVKVADFGIARAVGRATETTTGVLKGKVGYMPPEQLRFMPLDARADIFSLGVVLFELATGARLYTGASPSEALRRTLDEPPPDLGEHRSDAPPPLVDLLMRMLAKSPEHRPGSASEVVTQLEACLQGISGESSASEELAEYGRDNLRGIDVESRMTPIVSSATDAGPDADTRVDGSHSMVEPRRSRVGLWALGVGVAALGGWGLWTAREVDPAPSPTAAVTPEVTGRIVPSELAPKWVTPNSIAWAWRVQGTAADFARYELAISPRREDAESFAPASLLDPAEIPELDHFELPRMHTPTPVLSALTLGLEPSTVYYARLRATDIHGVVQATPVVAAKTAVASARSVELFVDGPAPSVVRPPCFERVSPSVPDASPHLSYEVACRSNGEGTCGPSDETRFCWENLVLGGIDVDIGKHVPSIVHSGYVEFELSMVESQPAAYGEVTLQTANGRFRVAPIALRSGPASRRFQVPFSAFEADGRALEVVDVAALEEFWVGGSFTRGGTVRLGQVRLRL